MVTIISVPNRGYRQQKTKKCSANVLFWSSVTSILLFSERNKLQFGAKKGKGEFFKLAVLSILDTDFHWLPEEVPSDRLGAPPTMVVGSSTLISGTTLSDLLMLGSAISAVTLIWIMGTIWSPSSLARKLLVEGRIIAFSWRRLFLSLMSLHSNFLYNTSTQCLKIAQTVTFNIASEAIYV